MSMLSGKVAIVTGCAKGIGNAVMELFAKEGALVYAIDRIENSIKSNNSNIIPCYFDITNEVDVKNLVARVKHENKHIDILVNNAGIMLDATIPLVTNEQISKTFNVNVFSMMHFIQYVSRIMMRQNSGSIINFASIMGIGGNANQMVYSASKGAVIALTKSVAKELANFNIRCNAVAPGTIDTGLLCDVPEDKIELFKSRISLGRLGNVCDVANAVLFFASDQSSYITGQVLSVDGLQLN